MEESASQIFLQLATGAVGGSVVGMLFERLSLGLIVNAVAGAIGGAVGCLTLEFSGLAGVHLVTDLASSTMGGAVFVAALGVAKSSWIRNR